MLAVINDVVLAFIWFLFFTSAKANLFVFYPWFIEETDGTRLVRIFNLEVGFCKLFEEFWAGYDASSVWLEEAGLWGPGIVVGTGGWVFD